MARRCRLFCRKPKMPARQRKEEDSSLAVPADVPHPQPLRPFGWRYPLFALQLALPLDVFLKEDVLAVIHHVGVLPYPVADDHQAGLAREHEVKLDVAVPEDEAVDVSVPPQVVLGVAHECLLVLALVGRLLAVGALQSAATRPLHAESHAPAGMQGGEHALAQAVVEHAAYEVELRVVVAQSVAVGEVEHLAVDVNRLGLCVQDHAALVAQVAEGPDVVVAGEVVHLHAAVCQLGELAEEAREAFWHHVLVLKPEVKHVAEQIDGGGLALYVVKEAHQPALLRAAVVYGERAQMGVGQDVDVLSHNYCCQVFVVKGVFGVKGVFVVKGVKVVRVVRVITFCLLR